MSQMEYISQQKWGWSVAEKAEDSRVTIKIACFKEVHGTSYMYTYISYSGFQKFRSFGDGTIVSNMGNAPMIQASSFKKKAAGSPMIASIFSM